MASFIDQMTKEFLGQGSDSGNVPEGQLLVNSDPPASGDKLFFINGIWVDESFLIQPDWEGLVSAVMGNAEFKAAWIAASAIDPTIAWSLPTAFGQVGQGYPGNFINLFEAICTLAEVSPAQRAAWADIGATFNAPAEFLDIVRGEGNV